MWIAPVMNAFVIQIRFWLSQSSSSREDIFYTYRGLSQRVTACAVLHGLVSFCLTVLDLLTLTQTAATVPIGVLHVTMPAIGSGRMSQKVMFSIDFFRTVHRLALLSGDHAGTRGYSSGRICPRSLSRPPGGLQQINHRWAAPTGTLSNIHWLLSVVEAVKWDSHDGLMDNT